MNGREPNAWLTSTLVGITAGHPNSRTDGLLSWNFKSPSSRVPGASLAPFTHAYAGPNMAANGSVAAVIQRRGNLAEN